MICRKCKTAVPATDKVCKYCGAKLTHSKIWIAAAVPVVVLAAVALAWGINDKQNNPPVGVAASSAPVAITNAPALPTETPEPVKQTEPVPVSNPDLGKELEQIWNMIDNVANAAQSYYDRYNSQVQFISKNGFLYDATAGEYVQPKVILDITDINEEYAKETVLILYLRPNDLRRYTSMSINENENFEIFAAYETKDGYAIASVNSAGGILPREDLKRIMDVYSCEHGEIVKYTYDSTEFSDIQKAILSYYPVGTGGFDVRYMAGDDKYAAAVVSPKGSPGRINAFVLEKEGMAWKVISSNLETKSQRYVFLNNLIIDMNLDILPKYDLHTELKYIKSDFTNLFNQMLKENIITNDDGEISFASGNDEFVYMELTRGKMFLGNYSFDNAIWRMHPLENIAQAEQLMKRLAIMPQPPYYLLKQY